MERIRKFILGFYILTLMTFGFWVNYTSFTLIIDVAGILLLIYAIISTKGKIRIPAGSRSTYQEFGFFLFGIFIVTVISFMNDIPFTMCVLGSRNYFEFMLLGFLISEMIPDEESHNNLLSYITIFSAVMCAFGLVQFIFHDYLPDALLRVRSGRLDYVYGLGDLIFRINALFENSIVFDGIIIISSALSFGLILVKGKSVFRLLCFGIAVTANILTFSRASIIGSVMVYAVEYILLGKKGKAEKYVRLLAVGMLGILLFITFADDTSLYQRLFNTSITATSDVVHRTTINDAQQAVLEHPWLGLGMGTQGYDSSGSTVGVIRDGCWYQFALELGLPLTVLYLLIIASLMIVALKRLKVENRSSVRTVCGAYLAIMIYFIVASFVNSAYNAKEVFGLCWVLTGMMLWSLKDSNKIVPDDSEIKDASI